MQRKHIQGFFHTREGFSTKASASFIICTAQTLHYWLSTDFPLEQDFTLDINTVLKWHIVKKKKKMYFIKISAFLHRCSSAVHHCMIHTAWFCSDAERKGYISVSLHSCITTQVYRCVHTYSVCSAFAVRIFFRTHVKVSERSQCTWLRSRSGAVAAVQLSFPAQSLFLLCCMRWIKVTALCSW